MSDVLLMNIPLMALFLGLWAGVPLWLVIRRADWHGKPAARTVPTYLAAQREPVRIRAGHIRVAHATRYDRRLAMR